MIQIKNLTRGTVLAENVTEARSFRSRLRGWLGALPPEPGQGLYLAPCRCVHTWGMRFAVDTIYVNRLGRIAALRTLVPGKVGPWVASAIGVLELPATVIANCGCQVGDQLEYSGYRLW